MEPDPSKPDKEAEQARWLAQLGATPQQVYRADTRAGGFLNADLLLLVRDRQNDAQDILAVDVSVDTAELQALTTDLTVGDTLLQMLESDYFYMAEKGAFARLAIETGETTGSLFTADLARYFRGFVRDKESVKLIQAASYAYSFREFTRRPDVGVLRPSDLDQLTYHI